MSTTSGNFTKKLSPNSTPFIVDSLTLDNGQSAHLTLSVPNVDKTKMTTITLQTTIDPNISISTYVEDNNQVRVEIKNQTGNDNVVIPQLDFIIHQI